MHGRLVASARSSTAAALPHAPGHPTVSVSASAAAQPVRASVKPKSRTKEGLDDPAQIGAVGTTITRVRVSAYRPCKALAIRRCEPVRLHAMPQDYGGDVSLASYMTLPIEQYFVLEPNQIKFLNGDRFLLTVPKLQFFNIYLEPEVEVSVSSQHSPPQVVIQAENCRIRGSELIENLKLDQKFCLRFVTELTWGSVHFDGSASDNSRDGAPGGRGGAPSSQGQITGKLNMDVWCEVVPPFNLMPRDVLQSSCNVVLKGLVSSLLPFFVKRLGEDYEKWATDAKYRIDRAARKKPLTGEESMESWGGMRQAGAE